MKQLKLKVSTNVIRHLGINLYNSLPAVLYELIANSYDAYSSNVEIYVEKNIEKNNDILIFDDGKGMSRNSFNANYLEVAKDSRNDNDVDPLKHNIRVKMGRKGLGKLSVYGISDTVIVYTKTFDNKKITAVEINYKEAVESGEKYTPKEFEKNEIPIRILNWFEKYGKGTVTVINSCRRNFNKLTLDKLKDEIERNFYLILENSSDPFDIFLTIFNQPRIKLKRIDPEVSFSYDFLFKFDDDSKGSGKMETILFNDEIKEKLNKEWKNSSDPLFTAMAFNKKEQKLVPVEIKIKGWIATLDTLKNVDRSTTGVPIIVRNRIVKKDITEEYDIRRFWSSYFVGELIMEFMDETELEDIISPNRQGFDSNVDDRYEKSKFIIGEILKLLVSKKDNRVAKDDSERKKKLDIMRTSFSKTVHKLKVPIETKEQLKFVYTNTTGLKTVNEDYIIFISHCSKKKCPKSYWMSKYLFTIINNVTKNSTIKVKRIVYTSDSEHNGRVKPDENIYSWMKNNALKEIYPNAIFLSCLSEHFLVNWNTVIEFGSAWAADKNNYTFLYDRKQISEFALDNGIQGEPLNLVNQNFSFKDYFNGDAWLDTFLFDIFKEKIEKNKFTEIINNLNLNDYKISDCDGCNQLLSNEKFDDKYSVVETNK